MANDIPVNQERYIETWKAQTMAALDRCAVLEGALATMQSRAEEQAKTIAAQQDRISSLVATVAAMPEAPQLDAPDPLGR